MARRGEALWGTVRHDGAQRGRARPCRAQQSDGDEVRPRSGDGDEVRPAVRTDLGIGYPKAMALVTRKASLDNSYWHMRPWRLIGVW